MIFLFVSCFFLSVLIDNKNWHDLQKSKDVNIFRTVLRSDVQLSQNQTSKIDK